MGTNDQETIAYASYCAGCRAAEVTPLALEMWRDLKAMEAAELAPLHEAADALNAQVPALKANVAMLQAFADEDEDDDRPRYPGSHAGRRARDSSEYTYRQEMADDDRRAERDLSRGRG